MLVRDRLDVLFADGEFADLYPCDGRPGFSPRQLALVSVLQFAEHLSDRADAVRTRIDFKYALVEAGLLKSGGRQRTDAAHVLAAVRTLSRLELAGVDGDWLLPLIEPEWGKHYGRKVEVLPQVEILRQVWVHHYHWDARGRLRWRDGQRCPLLACGSTPRTTPMPTPASAGHRLERLPGPPGRNPRHRPARGGHPRGHHDRPGPGRRTHRADPRRSCRRRARPRPNMASMPLTSPRPGSNVPAGSTASPCWARWCPTTAARPKAVAASTSPPSPWTGTTSRSPALAGRSAGTGGHCASTAMTTSRSVSTRPHAWPAPTVPSAPPPPPVPALSRSCLHVNSTKSRPATGWNSRPRHGSGAVRSGLGSRPPFLRMSAPAGCARSRYRGLARTHIQHVLTAPACNLTRIADWVAEPTPTRRPVNTLPRPVYGHRMTPEDHQQSPGIASSGWSAVAARPCRRSRPCPGRPERARSRTSVCAPPPRRLRRGRCRTGRCRRRRTRRLVPC